MSGSTHLAHLRSLLLVDRRRDSLQGPARTLFALFLGVLNLFFFAYCERYFAAGIHAPALGLVLLLESAALGVLALVTFFTTARETLRKTLLLPVGPLSRSLYVALAMFRDGPALAVALSGAFGLPVMLHAPLPAIPVALLAMLLLASGTQALIGSVALLAADRSESTAGLALVGMAAVLAALLFSLTFRAESIAALIPPVQWAAAAVTAAAEGEWGRAATGLLLLTAIPPAVILAAARWTERR